jgi:hypothetical protein
MAKMLTGAIDLNKIDKSKIITKDKNGNQFKNGAKYINIVQWINDEPDQYGYNSSIQIAQTKEEREQKIKPTYIANLKEFQKQNGSKNSAPDLDDDLPF